jgi:eukaryotic-like serine/threonine-protein kinase
MDGKPDCPDRATLASFLFGKLTPEEEEMVTLHMEACPACEAVAERLEQDSDPLIDALRQSPGTPVSCPTLPTLVAPAGRLPNSQEAPFHLKGYRILGEVGRGGMGRVYRAYQNRLKRVVAVKMILTGKLAGSEDRVHFLMEGELLARLNHPNFLQVHEVGTIELGHGTIQPYLVLEYVDGGTLKARMARAPLTPP